MMRNTNTEMRMTETRFAGRYIIEDSGVNYIYNELNNEYNEIDDSEKKFYMEARCANDQELATWNYEDNWHWNK